jgi:hypothetical protein
MLCTARFIELKARQIKNFNFYVESRPCNPILTGTNKDKGKYPFYFPAFIEYKGWYIRNI